MLYYQDPYAREGYFRVIERRENKLLLSDTILYPGGGGQPGDEGYVLCDNGKFRIRHIGDLWHEVDGVCNGDEVKIILNWEKRYLFMRSHTAEHAFFRILENKGARLGKVSIGEVSTIIFRGDLEVEDVLDAEEELKQLINEGRNVRTFWIKRDDLGKYPHLRAKLDRIKDNAIRVVEIEGHDLSACKGIHIKNLSEIGDFAIISFRMGKRKEVKFVVGEEARKTHEAFSKKLRKIMWSRNLSLENVEKYVENLEEENGNMLRALKEISSIIPFHKESCPVSIYTLSLPYGDYKSLQRRALEMANKNGDIVIFGIGTNMVCLAYPCEESWVREEFINLLKEFSGRGGGKGNFLSGSVNNAAKFIDSLKNIICEKAIQLYGDENGSN